MTTLEKLSDQMKVTPRHHAAFMVMSEAKAEIERMEKDRIEQEELFALQAQWHANKAQEVRELEKENAAFRTLEKCAIKRTEEWNVYRPDATLVIHAPHAAWDNKWLVMSDPEGTISATAETLPLAICLFAKQLFSK